MQTRFVLCAGLVAGLLNQAEAGAGPAPGWLWAQRVPGTRIYGSTGRAVTTDGAGNVYVTGQFSGSVGFGATNLATAGGADFFVAKVNSSGSVLWVRQARGGPIDYAIGHSVALDSAGNVYVAGGFDGEMDFGATNLNSGYFTWTDAFLVKYDSGGNFQWAWSGNSRSGGDSPTTYASAVAVAPDDTVVVSGHFRWFVGFEESDDGPTGLYGVDDAFIAKFTGAGNAIWYQRIGGIDDGSGEGWQDANALAFDLAGNLYVTGAVSHGANFGTLGEDAQTNVVSGGSSDIFVAKYTGAGQLLWVRTAGCATDGPDVDDPYDFGKSIAVDAAGNAYVTGAFAEPGASFGPTNLVTGNSHGFFLAKYNAEGDFLWARQSEDLALAGLCVRLDAADGVYVTRSSRPESIVQKYDSAGNLLWSQGAGAGSVPDASGLAIARAGSPYVTGQFRNLLTLDNTTFTNSGNRDLFLARLGSSLPRLAITASAGAVTLAWPIAAGDFQLQFANTLPSPVWQPLAETMATNGALRTVTLPATGASQFYRLWEQSP
jgi:hypothetical protein